MERQAAELALQRAKDYCFDDDPLTFKTRWKVVDVELLGASTDGTTLPPFRAKVEGQEFMSSAKLFAVTRDAADCWTPDW